VDVAGFITSQNLFDLLVLLVLFAAFILGFFQGTIRRLLGIASILFSFLVAAQVRDPLGKFLSSNWTQFPREYSYMLGFLIVFVAGSVAFSLVIQGFYKRTPLMSQATIVDEVLGGILGVLQALIILGAITIILDSFFKLPNIAPDNDELKFLRDFWNALDPSGTASVFRGTLIPGFFAVVGAFIPSDIRGLYRPFGG
jgi:membrane protein required for colicin V production